MIRMFIFSYAGDAAEAAACVRCARMSVPCASVTVVDDASHPVQKETAEALRSMGAEYVQSSWERHGNLRGPDCIRGMLSEMCREAEDDDILVKVDCDTALLDGGWLRWMEQRPWCQMYTSGDFVNGDWRVFGCLYALRGWIARRLYREMDWTLLDDRAPEDWTIGREVLARVPATLCRIDEPWRKRSPWSVWTAWCWPSRTVSAESYAARFAVVITGSPRMPDQPASERARVMHLLADARERMLREGVVREDDETVDWGDLLAACKGEAESMQTPCTELADRQVI